MTDLNEKAPRYPVLRLVVRHGSVASIVLAALVFCLAIALAAAVGNLGATIVALVLVTGALLAVLSYILCRIVVELVGLITDMLLPQ